MAATILLAYCLYSLPDGKLHIFVLDVGQGDSILLNLPTGEHILVDGGPDEKVLSELPKHMPFYEHTIDAMILTHPHADHMNGLIEVLKRYTVKQVLLTGVSYSNPAYKIFLEEIAVQHSALLFATNEHDFQISNLVLDLLYPPRPLQGQEFANLNNSSIVFRLLFGKTKYFFSGDLELEGETKLLKSNFDLSANVLKAAHHGSRTSNSPDLLDLVKPDYALISCGIDNKFKHPHPETIQHFLERGITIYRTDLNGTVEVVSDGEKIEAVKTER